MSKTQVKSNDRFSKFRMESPLGKFFTILLYVVMTIIVLIVLLPVLHIIAASFSDPQAMISGKDPTGRRTLHCEDMRQYLHIKSFGQVFVIPCSTWYSEHLSTL